MTDNAERKVREWANNRNGDPLTPKDVVDLVLAVDADSDDRHTETLQRLDDVDERHISLCLRVSELETVSIGCSERVKAFVAAEHDVRHTEHMASFHGPERRAMTRPTPSSRTGARSRPTPRTRATPGRCGGWAARSATSSSPCSSRSSTSRSTCSGSGGHDVRTPDSHHHPRQRPRLRGDAAAVMEHGRGRLTRCATRRDYLMNVAQPFLTPLPRPVKTLALRQGARPGQRRRTASASASRAGASRCPVEDPLDRLHGPQHLPRVQGARRRARRRERLDAALRGAGHGAPRAHRQLLLRAHRRRGEPGAQRYESPSWYKGMFKPSPSASAARASSAKRSRLVVDAAKPVQLGAARDGGRAGARRRGATSRRRPGAHREEGLRGSTTSKASPTEKNGRPCARATSSAIASTPGISGAHGCLVVP